MEQDIEIRAGSWTDKQVDGAGSGDPPGDSRDAAVQWLPMVEICDDDYRSFCWPCQPLEEITGEEGRPAAGPARGNRVRRRE